MMCASSGTLARTACAASPPLLRGAVASCATDGNWKHVYSPTATSKRASRGRLRRTAPGRRGDMDRGRFSTSIAARVGQVGRSRVRSYISLAVSVCCWSGGGRSAGGGCRRWRVVVGLSCRGKGEMVFRGLMTTAIGGASMTDNKMARALLGAGVPINWGCPGKCLQLQTVCHARSQDESHKSGPHYRYIAHYSMDCLFEQALFNLYYRDTASPPRVDAEAPR